MIYLDNSATTRALDVVADTVMHAMRTDYYNPSALYRTAVQSEKAMEACRDALKKCLNAQDIVYTASGTESDNLAIMGVVRRLRGSWEICLSSAEHPAVLQQREALTALGHRVIMLPLLPTGMMDLDAAAQLLNEHTALVSCMQVSNETGAIQPIDALSALMRKRAPQALLHVDGVQGFMRMPTDMRALGIDLYTLSAHKIHGPKGVGALALGARIKQLHPLLYGGGQENNLRPGTENTPGILGLNAALGFFMPQHQALASVMRRQKLMLWEAVSGSISGLKVNGPAPDSDDSAPHILNLTLPGVRGEVMLHALESKGILVGTGSACSSKKRKRSEGFTAMGIGQERAEGALRISLSPLTTDQEIQEAILAFRACYDMLKPYQRR